VLFKTIWRIDAMNEITKPGNPMDEFQARVVEKLRADIGAMLPDDALAGLVQRAIEEQFFKKRKVQEGSSYHRTEREIPSWFVEEAAKIATPLIETLVREYVANNKDQIKAAINEFLQSQHLLLLAMSAIRVETSSDIMEAAVRAAEQVRKSY
jgi:hypothetical protein